MIEKMTRYSFVLLNADKEEFLTKLQESGVIDITRSAKPLDERSERIMKEIEGCKALVSDIERGSDARVLELQEQLSHCKDKLSEVQVWGDYDREKLSALGIRYYCVPEKKFDPLWENDFALQEVLRDSGKVWFVTVGQADGFPVRELPAPDCTQAQASAALEATQNELDAYR